MSGKLGAMSRVTVFPGISLVTSSGGPAELAEAARLAEEAGFASVWATEFYDRSATVALAAMAQATNTIELGSATNARVASGMKYRRVEPRMRSNIPRNHEKGSQPVAVGLRSLAGAHSELSQLYAAVAGG